MTKATNIEPRRLPSLNSPNSLAVYDGQQRLGTIIKQDGEFFAFDGDGRCVGTFDTQIEAVRKIPAGKQP
jgi:hypothetical protein